MSSQDYNKLTVSQLRTSLSERDLDDKGKKSELVERLKGDDQAKLLASKDEGEEDMEHEEDAAEENKEDEEEEEEEDTMNATAESKEDKEHPLDTGEFIMLDEAGEDELENDINEDELLGEEEIEAAVKDEEDDEKDENDNEEEHEEDEDEEEAENGNNDDPVVIDDDEDEDDDDTKSSKDKKNKEKSSDRKSREKKDEKLHVVEGGVPEEDMQKLEAEFRKREAEEKAKEERIHEMRYIFRIYKHACLKFMEDGLNAKSIVIKKFKAEHLSNESVQEGVAAADSVNVHTEGNQATGYCELVIRNNKLNKEIRSKITEALPECEVLVASRSFLQEMVDEADKRFKKSPEFTEKYRECMLLACLEVTGDEQLEQMSPTELEDEVAPHFPDAHSITVPDSLDESKSFRFILVEYTTIKAAEDKLSQVRDDKPVIGGKKLEFGIYQRKWLDEKFKMRREMNEKKDPIRDLVRVTEDEPVMSAEERQACRMRIEQVYNSMKPYKKDDTWYRILSDEKTLMREKLRQDDKKRDKQKLPVLQWNPDKMKEEEKVEKKKDEKKDKDKKEQGTKDKKADDNRRRSHSRQAASHKRGRSPSGSRERGGSKAGARKQPRADRRRSPSPRRRGGAGRWQDNRQQNSIMGQPPLNNFQQMRGGNRMQQQQQGGRGASRMNASMNSRGGRGGMQQSGGRGGHVGGMPMMDNRQMNMMNNPAMMGGMHAGMLQQQQMHMQPGMAGAGMMGGMGVAPQAAAGIAANQGDGTSSNPVQLLLGLSKVLSNQIKQMQTSDQPAPAPSGGSTREYRDRNPSSHPDSYYRGGSESRGGGGARGGGSSYQGGASRSASGGGGGGYGGGGAGYY